MRKRAGYVGFGSDAASLRKIRLHDTGKNVVGFLDKAPRRPDVLAKLSPIPNRGYTLAMRITKSLLAPGACS
jgi:hypothetical protein